MHKILISCHVQNYFDIEFTQNFSYLLANFGYSIDIVSNRIFMPKCESVNFTKKKNIINNYELCFCINKIGFYKIKKIIKETPLIYILNSENPIKEFVDSRAFDYLIVVGNKLNLFIDCPSININIPYFHKFFNTERTKLTNDVVLIPENDAVLNSICPLINDNFLSSVKIFCAFRSSLKWLFNKNVSFIKQKAFFSCFNQSKAIIGSSQIIVKALLHGIPACILGSFGYGGVITLNNFQLNYKNGFNGRLGGYRDEFIPFELIKYDMESLVNLDKDNCNTLKDLMIKALKKEAEIVRRLIESFSHANISNYEIIKSHYFFYIKNKISETYYVVSSLTKKIYYEITLGDFKLIQMFSQYSKIDILTKHLLSDAKDDMIKNVKKLINMNLLQLRL